MKLNILLDLSVIFIQINDVAYVIKIIYIYLICKYTNY